MIWDLLWQTLMWIAITYENTNHPVKNAYSGYRGTMTIRDALKYSCNTIAVQCFRDVTPRLGYTYLKDKDRKTDHEVMTVRFSMMPENLLPWAVSPTVFPHWN